MSRSGLRLVPRHHPALGCALLALVTLASPLDGWALDEMPATLEGHGISHWGPIPAPADSVTARYVDRDPSAWEAPIDGLWWVVRAPFRVARLGVRGSVHWLEDSGTLATLGRLFAPVDLPWGFSASGSAGGVSGFEAGLAFYHDRFLGEGNRLRVKGAYSTRDERRITAGLVLPTTDESALEIGSGYRRRGLARYFGIGPATSYADESYFTQEAFWSGAIYQQGLGSGGFSLKARALYATLDARAPHDADEDEDERVPLADRFAGDLPTGYGDRAEGWMFGLSLQHDDASETGRPSDGGLHRLQVAYYLPMRSYEADFVSYRAESQSFVDLWWDRALAVRAVGSWIDDGGESVHFQHLMTNDDPDLLRGYDDFRWRDRGLAALTLEYRYPVWDDRDPGVVTVDAYTFFDTGQVFGDRDQIALDQLTRSYGFGFRLSAHGGFMGRVEIGISEEDTIVRLRADQMFQFDRQGLYHGREPIPLR